MPAILPQRRKRRERNYAPVRQQRRAPEPWLRFCARAHKKRPGPIHIGPGLRLSDCSLTALRPLARPQGNSDETCQNPKAYSRSAEAGRVLSKPGADPVRGRWRAVFAEGESCSLFF
jgi:hypothetical protein